MEFQADITLKLTLLEADIIRTALGKCSKADFKPEVREEFMLLYSELRGHLGEPRCGA